MANGILPLGVSCPNDWAVLPNSDPPQPIQCPQPVLPPPLPQHRPLPSFLGTNAAGMSSQANQSSHVHSSPAHSQIAARAGVNIYIVISSSAPGVYEDAALAEDAMGPLGSPVIMVVSSLPGAYCIFTMEYMALCVTCGPFCCT